MRRKTSSKTGGKEAEERNGAPAFRPTVARDPFFLCSPLDPSSPSPKKVATLCQLWPRAHQGHFRVFNGT